MTVEDFFNTIIVNQGNQQIPLVLTLRWVESHPEYCVSWPNTDLSYIAAMQLDTVLEAALRMMKDKKWVLEN